MPRNIRPLACILLAGLALAAGAQQRVKVDSTTPSGDIIMMDPARVDASALPLTPVGSLHETGTRQDVDLSSWRLKISGAGVATPLSLTYGELAALGVVKKRALLICSGFFYDYLEWEGVPLQALLDKAGAKDYRRVVFTSVDGYAADFSRAEIEGGSLVMVALKANGVPLPRTHGFPARLVAEDFFGSRWVKYLASITLE
jgi:DMSO/TMAO reductase YedYZ molybdopterin-dependent catalytic subunit